MHDSSLTAETLSHWLRDSGTLPCGRVENIRVELDLDTAISKLIFLTATYSSDAPANLPASIVVKTTHLPSTSSDEIDFFRQPGPMMGTPPLPRCLAAIRHDGGPGTLVLEDLRSTHDHRPWPLPPSRIECELAVDALVQVHAQWWESPALGQSVSTLPTHEGLTSMVQGVGAHLPSFFDAFGDAVTADARKLYERVFSSSLRPWLRLTDRRALTLIHGDAHAWNFLFPRSGSGPAFLIDWQLWHIDVAARDLAFLMALHWYPGRRRELERPLVRYYHERLLAQGVEGYTIDELWLDYRRCVVRNLTIPIIFWNRGMKPEGWWHRLECALAAYRDLDCDDLI